MRWAKARLGVAVGVGVVVVAATLFFAGRGIRSRAGYAYHVPVAANDGWVTASREEAGIDAGLIDELFEQIHARTFKNIHSVLLVRNQKLAVEAYFAGTHPILPETLKEGVDWTGRHQDFDRETLHTLQSATKSVASILIGLAIDQKMIASADEKISAFFPEFTGRDEIRLKHFLSMTAGLEWDEWAPLTDPRNDVERMNQSDDPIAMLLRRPSVAPPGTKFSYNSAASVALGEIVRKASGMTVEAFAAKHLFEPLGITKYAWKGRFPSGAVHTGGGLYLRPRDMAKIGCMMLNNGRWGEKQIVSESWVRESLQQQAPDQAYGYQWWIRSFDVGGRKVTTSWAGGYGGQYIFLFPEMDLVVVSTGWNPDDSGQFVSIMERYILPAMR